MALVNFYKETALPGVPVANSVYFVTDAAAAYVKVYVISATGVARRVHTDADIDAKITTALAGVNSGTVVATIAARDAQVGVPVGRHTLVTNATADATVASGGATYVLTATGPYVWQKISETESMDVITAWASITNKPTSSAASIDTAVTNSHTHANMTQLNALGDSGGELTYSGAIVKTEWLTTAW